MIIVTDREYAAELLHDVGGKPVEATDIEKFNPEAGRPVVIDIDLSNFEKVAALQRRLNASKLAFRIACAVDPNSYRARAQAFSLGATTLLPKKFQTSDLEKWLADQIEVAPRPDDAGPSVDQAAKLLDTTFAALAAETNIKIDEVQQCGIDILDGIAAGGVHHWLSIVRQRHEGTFQHCLIVTGLITNFAGYWNMSRADTIRLATAALLHDIGKVRIPVEILDKPGKLTPEEYEEVKTHTVIGYDYLVSQQDITDELLDAVRHHHEALDGSGYPDGISGNEINDLTRILTICDIYGAMIEHRPYKKQALPEEAFAVLWRMADEHKLEKALVGAFAKTMEMPAH